MSTGLNDNEIISKVLKGDQAAYAELVTRYQNYVFTLTLRMIKGREDAEEVAQDIFIKAYRSLSNFRGDAKFSTWLYTIVQSVCLTFLRKRRLNTHSLDNDQVFHAADNLDGGLRANEVETKSKVQVVREAIGRLGPDDAQVLTLFYQGEQSLEEISRIMGIEPNTAKVKLHRARQRLKTLMEKNYADTLKDWRDL